MLHLFTLFVWWEQLHLLLFFLILGGNTPRAYKAAFRYIVIQVGSGMFLLAGAVIFLYTNEHANFEMSIDETSEFCFLAFGIMFHFHF